MNIPKFFYLYIVFVLIVNQACALSFFADTPQPVVDSVDTATAEPAAEVEEPGGNETPTATNLPVVDHAVRPGETTPPPGKLIADVESSSTAAEERAPYGDSYKINRFERPFQKDMVYIPDMDILNFNLSQDEDWYYVSIELLGDNPNNSLGINYGVEIDLNLDGFGDYIIWAHPPYTVEWDVSIVQVFQDSNVDSGGSSVTQSENVFSGDGYDSLVFDGGAGLGSDPDLAWARMVEGQKALVQFAFKRSLIGSFFTLGVVSDAGLKDVSKFDYNDRFDEAEAGSPIRSKEFYPLGALYAVDNTCWEAYGFEIVGNEPKACQPDLESIDAPTNDDQGNPLSCDPPPNCDGNGGGAYDPNTCECQ
ncbi:hypothetical protein [Candidatus Villigracilis saccharophilus]|uniref:hypothetical protein n=1 Tax=Candidatus Villigracilis saccharophilus TaxID=3140684 RepID=UPI0031375E1E|nr:hypothetical protein [Anaerolineales bacterium]